MKRKGIKTTVLLFALVFCVSNVQAELITISLSATVNYIDGADVFGGDISFGSIITGSYTYESTTLDTNPLETVGDYWHYSSPAGIFLTVGGFEFKTNPNNVNFLAEVINNKSDIGDAYTLISYNNVPISESVGVGSISWTLTDASANAISSIGMPATTPILNLWQDNDLMIDGDGYGIHADVTSVELVPEPGTLLFLITGAVAVRLISSKKSRQI